MCYAAYTRLKLTAPLPTILHGSSFSACLMASWSNSADGSTTSELDSIAATGANESAVSSPVMRILSLAVNVKLKEARQLNTHKSA